MNQLARAKLPGLFQAVSFCAISPVYQKSRPEIFLACRFQSEIQIPLQKYVLVLLHSHRRHDRSYGHGPGLRVAGGVLDGAGVGSIFVGKYDPLRLASTGMDLGRKNNPLSPQFPRIYNVPLRGVRLTLCAYRAQHIF